MINGSAIEFIEDTLNQLRVEENRNCVLLAKIGEAERKTEDAEAKLSAAKENLFSVQRKLYAACNLIDEVCREYFYINFDTEEGRKRTDRAIEKMIRFQKEYDIHIENTEKGLVAK